MKLMMSLVATLFISAAFAGAQPVPVYGCTTASCLTPIALRIGSGNYDADKLQHLPLSLPMVGAWIRIVDAESGRVLRAFSGPDVLAAPALTELADMQYAVPHVAVSRGLHQRLNGLCAVDLHGQLWWLSAPRPGQLSAMSADLVGNFSLPAGHDVKRWFSQPLALTQGELAGQPSIIAALGSGAPSPAMQAGAHNVLIVVHWPVHKQPSPPLSLTALQMLSLTSSLPTTATRADNAGFYLPLAAHEQLAAQPTIAHYRVAFVTRQWQATGIQVRLYVLSLLTGEPVTDINQDQRLDGDDRVLPLPAGTTPSALQFHRNKQGQWIGCVGELCTDDADAPPAFRRALRTMQPAAGGLRRLSWQQYQQAGKP